MKRIFYLLLASLLLAGCQVINPNDRYVQIEDPSAGSDRVVLLLDFTGWKCTNCPDAAKIAASLLETYPDNFVVVSMHPEGSMFTTPNSEGEPDFASAEAMQYLTAFGGNAETSLPVGVIDMTKFDGNYLVNRDKWSTDVINRISVPSQYTIDINTASDEMYDLSFKCISGTPAANVNLLVWLVEDSIVAPQLGTTGEYTHRHVFRKCLNGSGIWGESFSNLKLNQEVNVSDNISLPTLEGKHFQIVALLVDGSTHQVLQCAEQVIESSEVPASGFFTLSCTDTAGTIDIHDGDTIDTYIYESDAEWMTFEGIIHAADNDVTFYIDETRDFDDTLYPVFMCVYQCMADVSGKGKWGPYTINAEADQTFSSHIMIPTEQQGDSHLFTTRFTFRNDDVTISFYVRYHYTPANGSKPRRSVRQH